MKPASENRFHFELQIADFLLASGRGSRCSRPRRWWRRVNSGTRRVLILNLILLFSGLDCVPYLASFAACLGGSDMNNKKKHSKKKTTSLPAGLRCWPLSFKKGSKGNKKICKKHDNMQKNKTLFPCGKRKYYYSVSLSHLNLCCFQLCVAVTSLLPFLLFMDGSS